jgi:hypothetical protein
MISIIGKNEEKSNPNTKKVQIKARSAGAGIIVLTISVLDDTISIP